MNEDYPKQILKIAAAQIAMNLGYESADESAINVLVDIMEMYIKEIGKKIRDITEHNQRTKSSFIDLLFSTSKT